MRKLSQIISESSSQRHKIGLDLHGVITKMPQFFSFFTKAMINAGAEIHIITGGATEAEMKFLEEKDIRWTHYFSILDYHRKIGTPTYGKHPKYGFDMISDEDWDKTKAEYCQREGIDLHIDDTENYLQAFTTPFCLFKYGKKD